MQMKYLNCWDGIKEGRDMKHTAFIKYENGDEYEMHFGTLEAANKKADEWFNRQFWNVGSIETDGTEVYTKIDYIDVDDKTVYRSAVSYDRETGTVKTIYYHNEEIVKEV